jgi:hypothetical protein
LKWVFAALIVAIAGFLLVDFRVATDRGSDSNPPQLKAIDSELEERSGGLGSDFQPGDLSELPGGESQPCLTAEQLESHPLLVQDSYRFDAVSDSGPTIASYRGLSEQELRDMSTQGDSAAMAVLGAMSVMRAREWPEEKAVPYLMLEDPELMAYRFSLPLSPEFLDHMAEARKWFYDAALHGRVLVLHRVGDSLSFEKGGAVELGWIDEAEYESLSSYEKTALMPANVYHVLALEVAPALKSGPHGSLISELIPRTERQRPIVDRLAEQFSRDLDHAGLPPVAVPESTAPSMDELLPLLCESELKRMKSEAEKVR